MRVLYKKVIDRLERKSFAVYRLRQKAIGFKARQIPESAPEFRRADGSLLNLQALLDELVQNGVVAIENYFSPAQIDAIAAKCARLVADSKTGVFPPAKLFAKHFGYDLSPTDGVLRFYNIDQEVPETKLFRDDPLPRFLGKQYYGRELRLETTLLQHNVVTENGTRNWHIDSWLNQLKTFLYLTDVEDNNGPFTYLLGSHANNDFLLRKTFACLNGKETTDVPDSAVQGLGLRPKEFYAKKGTLIIADTKGIHQGATLTRGTRSILANYFYLDS